MIFAGVQSGFGNTVVVDNGGGVTTLYGHLSSIGVSPGQSVGDGEQLALSGNTGTTSGPNLHFAVFDNGVAVDPMSQLGADLAGAVDTSGVDLSSVFTSADGSPDPVMIGGAALLAGLLVWAVAS